MVRSWPIQCDAWEHHYISESYVQASMCHIVQSWRLSVCNQLFAFSYSFIQGLLKSWKVALWNFLRIVGENSTLAIYLAHKEKASPIRHLCDLSDCDFRKNGEQDAEAMAQSSFGIALYNCRDPRLGVTGAKISKATRPYSDLYFKLSGIINWEQKY